MTALAQTSHKPRCRVEQDFKSVSVPLEFLLEIIPPLQPRQFSVASSNVRSHTRATIFTVTEQAYPTPPHTTPHPKPPTPHTHTHTHPSPHTRAHPHSLTHLATCSLRVRPSFQTKSTCATVWCGTRHPTNGQNMWVTVGEWACVGWRWCLPHAARMSRAFVHAERRTKP